MPVRCISLWSSILYAHSAGSFHSGYKSLSFMSGTLYPSDTGSLQHWSKSLKPQSSEMRGDLPLREQRALPPWDLSGTEPAAGFILESADTPGPRKATALSQEQTQLAPEGWTPNTELWLLSIWMECHSRSVTAFKVSVTEVLSSYYSL